jgi:hypothetical protein
VKIGLKIILGIQISSRLEIQTGWTKEWHKTFLGNGQICHNYKNFIRRIKKRVRLVRVDSNNGSSHYNSWKRLLYKTIQFVTNDL